MATGDVSSLTAMETSSNCEVRTCSERLKMLYPMVNEEETPLPESWSQKDKYTYIGLSQNNMRVHYKGWSLVQACHRAVDVVTAALLKLHCFTSFYRW